MSYVDLLKIKTNRVINLTILIDNYSLFDTSHRCDKSCAFLFRCQLNQSGQTRLIYPKINDLNNKKHLPLWGGLAYCLLFFGFLCIFVNINTSACEFFFFLNNTSACDGNGKIILHNLI